MYEVSISKIGKTRRQGENAGGARGGRPGRCAAAKGCRRVPRAIILGTLLFATLNSLRAQDASALPTAKPNSTYPSDAEITFQWNYSCPSNNACTFRCQGAGGADHLTRLDIYLGTLPVNGDQQQRAPAIFYDFSSRGFPHGNGFAISTGINTLSCQVSGMTLDYSGPPK